MRRLLSVVNVYCALAAGIVLLVGLAAVLYAVFARAVFNIAVTWAFDLTSYGLLFVGFLAASRTLEIGGHIRVDFLRSRLSARRQRATEVVMQLLGLVFMAMLLWAVSNKTWLSIEGDWVSPSIYEIPLRYVYWIMPVGVLLMLLTGLVKLGEAVVRWRAGEAGPVSHDPAR
jgi:TRAP-type C4-dicarboxylate transport system permease small subunit